MLAPLSCQVLCCGAWRRVNRACLFLQKGPRFTGRQDNGDENLSASTYWASAPVQSAPSPCKGYIVTLFLQMQKLKI